jgi:signal transduction histidine kinase
MRDEHKSQERLLDELAALRQPNAKPEGVETERRRSEATLEQSLSLLQATLESTADGILVVDNEGKITAFNQKMVEMWRIPESAFASRDGVQTLVYTLDQLVDPDGFLARVVELNNQPEAEGSDLVELKDGRVFERYSQPQRMDGKIVGRVWSHRDVTARTRAENTLRQRAAQLAVLNDIGEQIAAVLELDRLLERAARLVQESFGYYHVGLFTLDRERQELVLQANAGSYTRLFHDHRLKVGQGMVGWAAQHGKTLLANDVSAEPQHVNPMPDEERMATQSELSVPVRVGEEVIGVIDVQSPHLNAFDENDVMVIETLADQIAVANENARLYKAVQQELTERARAEKQLRRYADELAQANEEVKRFTYVASHNLRTPLINLKGFAVELQVALEVVQGAIDGALPHLDERQQQAVTTALQEDIPEALGFIDSSVTYMDGLVNALLKLSRLGRRELDLEPVDMEALVRANLETLAHQIEERQVQVTVGPLPKVVADRISMEQIVASILSNAVKYLAPNRPGEIEISAECGEDETTFRVRDNGRGIAEEDMHKVLALFRRAGRQDVPGEGVSLTYVQTLVRRHGGRIWCESELGAGTTFYFTLSNHREQGDVRA